MKARKWIYAIAAIAVIVLVMFPLNLLWVGKSPPHAFVSSLLFALPALLVVWSPQERRSGRRAGHAGGKFSGAKLAGDARSGKKSAGEKFSGMKAAEEGPSGEKPAEERPRLSKVVLGICLVVLAAMLVYDIYTEGAAVGITKSIGFVMLILVAIVGYRFGYLKL